MGRRTAWIVIAIVGAAAAALLLFANLKREPTQENVAGGVVDEAAREAPSSDEASSESSAAGGVGAGAHKPTRPSQHSGRSGSARSRHGEIDLRTRRVLESLGYYSDADFISEKLILPDTSTYSYDAPFVSVAEEPLSRFSGDVDTASYTQMRRLVRSHSMPPGSSVRIEEFLNYFDYAYPAPKSDEPFGIVTEVSEAPWNGAHLLMRVGIKAPDVNADRRPPANLVFLVDVSQSMSDKDKLPLLKQSISLLLKSLGSEDRIAIVAYAGVDKGVEASAAVVMPSTAASSHATFFEALERLELSDSGKVGTGTIGADEGGAGIELAYQIAQKSFIEGGVNRVILATDGDLNVGPASRPALTQLIAQNAKSDIFLSVLGVGMANFGDEASMKLLSETGQGNYAYVDSLAEARKVLAEQIHGPLVTVAKDVTFQIAFNPMRVAQYRLIGYEHLESDADGLDDLDGARDIRAGHAVTALYELIPSEGGTGDKLLTLMARYKTPSAGDSRLMSYPVLYRESGFASASADFKFASAVAGFGMLLRGSPHKGNTSFEAILDWARQGRGSDPHGYRHEFISLVKRAKELHPRLKHHLR